MAVHLDLRRDLPKLQRAMPKLLLKMGGVCEYSQPCAVGCMVNPRKRAWLDGAPYDNTQIDTLITRGMVRVPDRAQKIELRELQICFDSRDAAGLQHLVDQLAEKYGALRTPAPRVGGE